MGNNSLRLAQQMREHCRVECVKLVQLDGGLPDSMVLGQLLPQLPFGGVAVFVGKLLFQALCHGALVHAAFAARQDVGVFKEASNPLRRPSVATSRAFWPASWHIGGLGGLALLHEATLDQRGVFYIADDLFRPASGLHCHGCEASSV